VKKLRRNGIRDVAAATDFLETEYWAEHNRRFARPPGAADDFHVAVPRGLRLDQVFRLEETRRVSNDWVVRYDNRLLQLERQTALAPARSTVLVYEDQTGQIEIRYRERRMQWTDITAAPRSTPAPAARTARAPAPPRHGQLRDHPWRNQAVDQHYAYRQFARDRRAWARVQP
jgi:hypothetical protein